MKSAQKLIVQSTATGARTGPASIRRSFATEEKIVSTDPMSCRATAGRRRRTRRSVARKLPFKSLKLEDIKSFASGSTSIVVAPANASSRKMSATELITARTCPTRRNRFASSRIVPSSPSGAATELVSRRTSGAREASQNAPTALTRTSSCAVHVETASLSRPTPLDRFRPVRACCRDAPTSVM